MSNQDSNRFISHILERMRSRAVTHYEARIIIQEILQHMPYNHARELIHEMYDNAHGRSNHNTYNEYMGHEPVRYREGHEPVSYREMINPYERERERNRHVRYREGHEPVRYEYRDRNRKYDYMEHNMWKTDVQQVKEEMSELLVEEEFLSEDEMKF